MTTSAPEPDVPAARPSHAFRVGAAIGAGIVLVLVLAVVTGAVDIPDIEQAIRDIGPTLGQWTYALVGGLAFLETAAFIGLAVPGELTIVLGGFVAGQGVIELIPLILLVWAAAVAGDAASYWLGRRLGRGFVDRHGPRFGATPDRIDWADRFFARHGGKTILIGRFIGFFRSFGPFLAGTSRMSFRRFIVFDVVGAGLWSVTFSVLGYVFWESFDRAVDVVGQVKIGAAIVVALVVALVVVRQAKKGLAARSQRQR